MALADRDDGCGNRGHLLSTRWMLMLLLAVPVAAAIPPGTPEPLAASSSTVPIALPVAFEVNRGQAGGPVRYIARTAHYTLFVTDKGVLLSAPSTRPVGSQGARHTAIWLRPEGMSPRATVVAQGRLPGIVNYFIGNNPSRWHTDIPTYTGVRYRSVYPGIDLHIYAQGDSLEYDWIAAAGADLGRIRMRVTGAAVKKNADGTLLLHSGQVRIRQGRPLAYSALHRAHFPVSSRYVVHGRHDIGFQVGPHPRSAPLVIDPTLVYSSYLGGDDDDGGYGLAVDSKGNAYITGDSQSANFPLEGAAQSTIKSDSSCVDPTLRLLRCPDAFVSKISADGHHLVYSTFLGGSEDDYGHGIAVDAAGNAYITGNTLSANFPTAHALQSHYSGGRDLGDAFVTKLNPQGNGILFSTYLGGSGEDDGEALVVKKGNLYIVGSTNSTNFPTSHAWQNRLGGGECGGSKKACFDAFAVKMPVNGAALTYSTYIGGSRDDLGTGVAVFHGRAFVTGSTNSSDFPTVHALQRFGGGSCGIDSQTAPCTDAFLTKLNPKGSSAAFSTYIGGNADDRSNDVAVDKHGDAYIGGATQSTNFPLVHPFDDHLAKQDLSGFVAKVNASGSALVYSTYLGGSDDDEVYGVAVDRSDRLYATGSTISDNFPTKDPIQRDLPSNTDIAEGLANAQNAFVTAFKPGGEELIYSTYLGGTDHDLGAHIVARGGGLVYITGFATSRHFPITKGAFQGRLAGSFDAFVAKISPPPAAHAG